MTEPQVDVEVTTPATEDVTSTDPVSDAPVADEVKVEEAPAA